mgnify:CR=1 FL=1
MISKLRGFSNSKLAGVLVGIIIIPFVFWGMGSVFSGGNTNNVAKINNEAISSKDFVNFINESRLTNDIIKANIDKNIIEQILSELVSEKLIEMEIKELNVSMSEEALANKIRSNSILLDDNKKFSRVKYEKFLLENNLSASTFENSLKKQELKENLFNLINEDGTTEASIEAMSNADKAMVEGRKINKPTKGISVFDFDDTLAFSNSKVIVTIGDKTFKITPAEFAQQSEVLEKEGAIFDFKEFNKVVKGRKGPLADLALKRQNKFGSGDIFVLTARPQASARSIQKFLKGIGLDIPLKNITGLENGSPQAVSYTHLTLPTSDLV